jgi:hypothetical protein
MKKNYFLFSFLFLLFVAKSIGQVGVNTTTPNPNAVLDVHSAFSGGGFGGFLPPRVTLAQRNMIPVTATDDGLMAYVTLADGSRCLQLFNGATLVWEDVKCFEAAPFSGRVFFESMGNVTTNTPITTHHANLGFDNSATCIFSSTTSTQAQVRASLPSSDVIPTASGGGNVFFTLNANRNFIIDNIDVTAYSGPLTLKLLIHKSTVDSNGSELTIEYSSDGIVWTNISVSNLPTGTGTSTWHERTLSTTIPNTIKLLRFVRGGTLPEFRIDDIEIIVP